jgi:HEAT repeat protein
MGCQSWPSASFDGRGAGEVAKPLASGPVSADPFASAPGKAERSPSFDAPEAAVKIAALHAWLQTRRDPLPAEALRLTTDVHPTVRAAAVRAIGSRPPPDAETRIAAALEDHEVEVRLAAIEALGMIGSAASRARLETLRGDHGELVRAAAVRALGRLGADEAVFDALGDPSWRVRKEVAAALACRPGRHAAAIATGLLDDPSAEVQSHAVESAAVWPLRLAGPVLLEAMGKPCGAVRRTAAARLAAQWPPASEFAPDAPPDRRRAELDRLRGRFVDEFGLVNPVALADAARRAQGGPPPRTAEASSLIRQLGDPSSTPQVRADALAGLQAFGPELVPALEHLARVEKQTLPEPVWESVLPRADATFAAIERLRSHDLIERRRAAEQLVRLANQRPLGILAAARLADVAAAEPDPLVLQGALGAVAGSGGDEATRLAYAAMSHPSPDVRRAACEYLAAHPRPEHAAMLAPALDDAHPAVVAAAIRALAAGGRLDDPSALRRLLGSSSDHLALESAAALAQLGDPAGAAALERLAKSHDAAIRRQAAEAMGRTADPIFVPALVRLLDDQEGTRRAALESLSKVTGRNPPKRDGRELGMAERVAWWKQNMAAR